MPHVKHYYCTDCSLRFTVYRIKPGKRKCFCPSCGDSISVKKYDSEIDGKPRRKKPEKRWTDEEEKRLLYFLRETYLYRKEIAAELGRTLRSVNRKAERMLAEGKSK